MDKFEQLFKKVDDRLTARRAWLTQAEDGASVTDYAVLHAVNTELLEQQIKLRTDRLRILYPYRPLGRLFFWKVKFKAFFYRHGLLTLQ